MTTPQQQPGYWTPNNRAPQFATTPGQRVNYYAWIGLIVSVSGFVFNLGINGVVGVIFSILGMRDARRLAAEGVEQTGHTVAVVGLITGLANIVVTVGIVVLSIFAFIWFNDWVRTFVDEVQLQQLPR